MLTFIGLVVIWVILALFLTMVINTFRVKNGVDINDRLTVIMKAVISGPLAIMGAFSFEAKATGEAIPMMLGGIIGTVIFINIYLAL